MQFPDGMDAEKIKESVLALDAFFELLSEADDQHEFLSAIIIELVHDIGLEKVAYYLALATAFAESMKKIRKAQIN